MFSNKKDLMYFFNSTAGFPGSFKRPLLISSHITRLSLVYGAGPYTSCHHVGSIVIPNISQGQMLGRSVSYTHRYIPLQYPGKNLPSGLVYSLQLKLNGLVLSKLNGFVKSLSTRLVHL